MPWALYKSFLYGVVGHFLEICEKDIAKTRHQMQVQNWIPGVQKGEKTEAWRNAVCVWRHAKRTREAIRYFLHHHSFRPLESGNFHTTKTQ